MMLYLEIFNVSRRFRILVWTAFALNFCTYAPQIPVFAILCTPAPGQPWTLQVQVKCGQSHGVVWGLVQSSLSVITDLFLFLLPIPMVPRLQMPRARKPRIIIIIIFATAILCVSLCGLSEQD